MHRCADGTIFVLADKSGMIHDFIPYTGKIEPVMTDGVPDLGASSRLFLSIKTTYCILTIGLPPLHFWSILLLVKSGVVVLLEHLVSLAYPRTKTMRNY